VGLPLDCKKGRWKYDGGDPQPGERFVVLKKSWQDGQIQFEDQRVKEIKTYLVVEQGLWGKAEPGWSKYTAVMVVNKLGCIGTFTSSSYGGHYAVAALVPQYRMQGQRSYPIVELETKERGDQYGNIDPVLKIVGWAPKSAFAAITDDMDGTPSKAIGTAVPEGRKVTDIIDDDLPKKAAAAPALFRGRASRRFFFLNFVPPKIKA
jgi:hypothetical protein